jgi:hypothetical protein
LPHSRCVGPEREIGRDLIEVRAGRHQYDDAVGIDDDAELLGQRRDHQLPGWARQMSVDGQARAP